MAGIGFELRKMLEKDSYFHDLVAFSYAALLSSGPWVLSILCLAVLGFYRTTGLTLSEHEVFRSTVIYTYAFSLIFTGVSQLVVTRYLADQLYVKEHRYTMRTLCTSACLTLVVGAPVAVLFYLPFQLSALYKFFAVLAFLVVCLIWLAMVFLSVIKDYNSIALGFFVGSACSVAGAMYLKGPMGMEGYLLGFVIGQAVIFFWLFSRLLAEFPDAPAWDRGLMRYFLSHWELPVIGLAYNLGIWMDKIVFWVADEGARTIRPYLVTHDLYEGPVFVAYLTVVPALAIFLLKMETRFYECYRRYYARVVEKSSFASILREKEQMVDVLKKGFREVLILQGAVTALCMIFAPGLAQVFRFDPLQMPILRIAFMGAFFQVLLIICIVVLFYFDLRRDVLAVAIAFVLSNAALTWWTIQQGLGYYGYGYCYACLISLVLAFSLLSRALDSLEYLTFTKQPAFARRRP
ncbi:hypothetical protein DPQ33_02495 [Oceanidesulfovibrio indonesiensis]|uniref:Histidine kinase n=1 Tax=Oceanidesulfovibrio indonesiensis TaxID=54767 RepID=A0A7M3MHT0_9BACT|nr:exopolysaccharide Pel transporter PelG [Oceanidesulfovibrio indonesiensis]TVM19248.1 hypothetical protein DPQ33_02495 [Oceanidesulfovibrio indonesiensis]